jgi:hypothetical protein
VLKLLKSFFEKAKSPAPVPDPLLSAIAEVFPSGPVRRGSLRGVHRAQDLTNRAPVTDEILFFDGGDHWFCVFLGCRALGLPFELSFRTAKQGADDPPPHWPIEPVTRVANAIGDGAECALGVTWRIDSPAIPSFAGFATLRDLQFGAADATALYQLVPVTAGELDLKGEEHRALIERLAADRSRMIGAAAKT